MKKILKIIAVTVLIAVSNTAHALENTSVLDSLNALSTIARSGNIAEFDSQLSQVQLAMTDLANTAAPGTEAGKLLTMGLESIDESSSLKKLREQMGDSPTTEALLQAQLQEALIQKFSK